jgi:hypothetical protein
MANGQARAFGPKDEVLRNMLQSVPPGTPPQESLPKTEAPAVVQNQEIA